MSAEIIEFPVERRQQAQSESKELPFDVRTLPDDISRRMFDMFDEFGVLSAPYSDKSESLPTGEGDVYRSFNETDIGRLELSVLQIMLPNELGAENYDDEPDMSESELSSSTHDVIRLGSDDVWYRGYIDFDHLFTPGDIDGGRPLTEFEIVWLNSKLSKAEPIIFSYNGNGDNPKKSA